MHSDFHTRSQALEGAFQVFNEVSAQLVLSYRQLELQVERLSAELSRSRSERMQQLAEKEKLAERLSKLLDALPAGVVLLDGHGRVREINPVARDLVGPVRLGEDWQKVWERAFLAGDGPGERALADGRTVILTERTLDQAPGRILVLQDVTESRALQLRLERLQRLSAMGEMAAKLAHQVRTPLSSALLYVGHLERDELEPRQRRRFADRLRDRLRHMEHQVNDILAFSRGHGERFERIDLSGLAAEAVRMIQPLAEARQARVTLVDRSGGDGAVLGNPDALLGVFSNLIGNALVHVGDGVRVRVGLDRTTDGMLALTVEDDGPGVPADIRGQVFDPFFTTRSDGTGLGLAVVQSVALGHRGRVRLDSPAGGGACFVVELPPAAPGAGQH
jgi:two-component system sensor histidine kinase FlrB